MLEGLTAPDVACRIAEPDEVPTSARRLAERAIESGWHVNVTYAHATTDKGKAVDSINVRAYRGQLRLGAIYENGKFVCALLRVGGDYLFARRLSARQANDLVMVTR